MPRFSIGSHIKIVGVVAEHYGGATARVIDVIPHAQGLAHLYRYQVRFADESEDTFYEFQLAAAQAEQKAG